MTGWHSLALRFSQINHAILRPPRFLKMSSSNFSQSIKREINEANLPPTHRPSFFTEKATHTHKHTLWRCRNTLGILHHTHRSMCAHKALFPLDSLFVLVVQQQRGQSLNCTMATKQVTSTLYKLWEKLTFCLSGEHKNKEMLQHVTSVETQICISSLAFVI